jgi:acyl-CoA reductase-like NAD-dependent aldehyde dehydrogenase
MDLTTIQRENPAFPSRIVGQVESANAADVERAVVSAHHAQLSWERESIYNRCQHLTAALDALTPAVCDQIASTLCLELGKPIVASHGELAAALRVIRHFIEIASDTLQCESIDDQRGRLQINKIPFGVVAAIIPWNAPLFVSALKFAPALLAGNTVLLKSSPLAPLAVSLLLDCFSTSLPKNVLQVLHGHVETGRALVQHRLIRKLSFTGGASVARDIQSATSHLIRPSLLELGGNDAALLLDDADLSEADFEQLVFASFYSSGQLCIGCKRIYVPRHRLDSFLIDFCNVSDNILQIGDPMQPDVSIGPVVSCDAQHRLEALASSASREAGVMLQHVGHVVHPDVFRSGYYVHPAVVVGLSPRSPLACEEQFGPLIPILPYDNVDEAIAEINSTEYGLGGSVWSSDENQAFTVASRFQSGIVFVNCHGRAGLMPHVPFGGLKDSGYGRESGSVGLLEYVQSQSIFVPSGHRR